MMRTKTTKLRTESPPSSKDVCPPSTTCRPAVASARTAGRPRATAYQRAPTRQRATRPSRSRRPALPSATAATTIAASAGPKRAGNPHSGETDTRGIRGHVRAYARTKNAIKGWRLTKAVTVLKAISSLRLQGRAHGRDHEEDEGQRRSQPPDHVEAEVAVARRLPVRWRRVDLPSQEDPVERLGYEGRGEHRAAPEREQPDRGQHERDIPRVCAQHHEHRDGREARREHHGVVQWMGTRYLQEALHHQGELGTGQVLERPLEEELHGHQEPREEPGAQDYQTEKNVSQGHDGCLLVSLREPAGRRGRTDTAASVSRYGSCPMTSSSCLSCAFGGIIASARSRNRHSSGFSSWPILPRRRDRRTAIAAREERRRSQRRRASAVGPDSWRQRASFTAS